MATLGTFTAGQVLTAAELNAIGTWTSYTPTVTQGATVTATVLYSKYSQINDVVHWVYSLVLTSAGTAGQWLQLSLPVSAEAGQRGPGIHQFFDSNTVTTYIMTSFFPLATTMSFVDVNSGASVFGAAPAVTAANGDLLFGSITYVAA